MSSNQQSGECIGTQVQRVVIKSILFKMVVVMSVSYVWGCSYLLYAIGRFCEKYSALFLFSKIINLLPIYLKGKYRNSRPKMNVYNTMKIAQYHLHFILLYIQQKLKDGMKVTQSAFVVFYYSFQTQGKLVFSIKRMKLL